MGLTLRDKVSVEQVSANEYIVDGTPVDCVYLGLNNLCDTPIDLVVSGINNGPNLADDIFYSGTFAAAMEARRMALPALSVSITQREVEHYESAAHVAVKMANALPKLKYHSLLAALNINMADLPINGLRGYKATLMSEREAPIAPQLQSQDGSISTYLAGPAGDFRRVKRNRMQDFEAVEQSYVSVTPLSSNFDNGAYVDDVQSWLDTL